MVYLLREGIKRREVIFLIFLLILLLSRLDRPCGSGWLPLTGFGCLVDIGFASCLAQKVVFPRSF